MTNTTVESEISSTTLQTKWSKPSTPLSERVELGTDAWTDCMRSFLTSNSHTIPTDLRVSVSERFTDPPPHVDCDQDCGYTVRFSRSEIEVTSQPEEDADFYREGDYNAAIPFFTRIVGEDNESDNRVLKEYLSLFGAKYPAHDGFVPHVPEIQDLLVDLHNHLARRTVNNPDVEHRIHHLGLEAATHDLETKGYAVLPNAFTAEFADELRRQAHANHDAAPPNTGFRATMLLLRGRVWEEAVIHPWVIALMEFLLGRGCLIYQSDTIIKGPGLDTHPGLHADYGASRVTEPFPEYCVEATSIWAIDEFSMENGPTVIIPGSFQNRRQVPPGTGRDGATPIVMEQGSIALWHGGSWHGALPRTAKGTRTSLHNAYVRHFMRTLECYYDIPQSIIDRNPAIFSTLCGVDDALGKSGYVGADFERMRYAAQAGFGAK